MIDIDTVYRFLDKLNNKLKVEQIAFTHTKKILNNSISVVFYDMTTLTLKPAMKMICARPDLVKMENNFTRIKAYKNQAS